MGLAPLQRQRFIFLLGPRYTGSDKIKLVCKQYNTYHENYVRLFETLREIYWEAKRAPETNTTALKNPYRRETLKKKFYGKTREERIATMEKLKAYDTQVKLEFAEKELGLEKDNQVKQESLRQKRRENAAKRMQLGFNNKGKEEVEDPILEELQLKNIEHQKQIEEQKERKPVPLVTEVKGISREEIDRLMLSDHEKFRAL